MNNSLSSDIHVLSLFHVRFSVRTMAQVSDYFNHLIADKVALVEQLRALNDFLLNRTFLVGERLSSSDINAASALLPLYQVIYIYFVCKSVFSTFLMLMPRRSSSTSLAGSRLSSTSPA